MTTHPPLQPAFPPLLRELAAIPGISGHEDAVARYLAGQLTACADSVAIDRAGNVIARFGLAENPAVALLAHMDTVGLMVNRMNRDGTYGAVALGGVNLKGLPAAPVRVGEHAGVVGVRSQHQARGDEGLASIESLYLDVGGAAVEITTPVTYATTPVALAGGFFAAPYMDNRAGCAVLLEIARRLVRPDGLTVYLIGTVQEETNSLGAFVALEAIRPAAALFIDGTVSHDTPETAAFGQVRLGGGPVLTAYLYTRGGNGWHAHPGLRAHLKSMAARQNIPYQQDAVTGLISDAKTSILLGLPSAIIGLPMRGKHAPLETIHLDDLAWAVELALGLLATPLPDLRRG